MSIRSGADINLHRCTEVAGIEINKGTHHGWLVLRVLQAQHHFGLQSKDDEDLQQELTFFSMDADHLDTFLASLISELKRAREVYDKEQADEPRK